MNLPETKIISKNAPIAKSTAIVRRANVEFSVDEIVWGKLRGHSHWPCKIISIEQNRFVVTWFNDYRNSTLFRTQMFKFMPNFKEFAKKFSSSVALETAAKEALISLAQKK